MQKGEPVLGGLARRAKALPDREKRGTAADVAAPSCPKEYTETLFSSGQLFREDSEPFLLSESSHNHRDVVALLGRAGPLIDRLEQILEHRAGRSLAHPQGRI